MSIGTKKQTIINYIYNGLIFFVLILALTIYIANLLDHRKESSYNLNNIGKLQRMQIEAYLQNKYTSITEIALDAQINQVLLDFDRSQILTQQNGRILNERLDSFRSKFNDIFLSISIINSANHGIIATSSQNKDIVFDNFYQGFIHSASQSNDPIASKVFLDTRQEQPILILAKSIFDKNKEENPPIILVEIDFYRLLQSLQHEVYIDYSKQISYLINEEGQIIGYFGNPNYNVPILKEKYKNEVIRERIKIDGEHIEIFKGHVGNKVLGYYSYIPDVNWYLLIEQNEKEFYIYALRQGLTYISIILLVWIGLFILKKHHTEQIYEYAKEFEDIVTSISNGKDDIDLHQTGYQEIDSLYEAFSRLRKNLKHQKEKQDIILKIANTLAINIELEKLLEELLPNVIEGTKSHWGAFYIMNNITGKLEIKASRGLSKNVYKEFDISIGEGLIGQAALDNKIKIIKDIPLDTVYVARTFLGKIKPKSIMTIPILFQGNMMGILVLGSIYNYKEEQVDIVKVIRYYLGVAISNGLTYERTQRLSKELKFQNQLIQNMNDELEDKVRERTDFLDNIINSIKEYAIVSLDQHGFITTWNKGAELLKGYKANEVIGEHISMLYSVEEISQGKVEKQLEIAKNEGQYVEYGWKLKKDGERFFADFIITPMYDKNSNLIGFTNIIKDITISKKMEQALLQERNFNKKVLEKYEDFLILLDEDGEILKINDKVEKQTGYTKEELTGRLFQDYFDSSHEILQGLEEILKRGSREGWKVILRHKNSMKIEMILEARVLEQDGFSKNIFIIGKTPQ